MVINDASNGIIVYVDMCEGVRIEWKMNLKRLSQKVGRDKLEVVPTITRVVGATES